MTVKVVHDFVKVVHMYMTTIKMYMTLLGCTWLCNSCTWLLKLSPNYIKVVNEFMFKVVHDFVNLPPWLCYCYTWLCYRCTWLYVEHVYLTKLHMTISRYNNRASYWQYSLRLITVVAATRRRVFLLITTNYVWSELIQLDTAIMCMISDCFKHKV